MLSQPLLAKAFVRYFGEHWVAEAQAKASGTAAALVARGRALTGPRAALRVQAPGALVQIDSSYLQFWLQAEEFANLKACPYRAALGVEIYQRFFAHGANSKARSLAHTHARTHASTRSHCLHAAPLCSPVSLGPR